MPKSTKLREHEIALIRLLRWAEQHDVNILVVPHRILEHHLHDGGVRMVDGPMLTLAAVEAVVGKAA